MLEWVAMSSSRGSSRPRDRTRVSRAACIGRRVLYHCTPPVKLSYNVTIQCLSVLHVIPTRSLGSMHHHSYKFFSLLMRTFETYTPISVR